MQILQHINENMARKKCYAIKMYSTHNKEKYVVAERFIRTFKKKHKYMTSVSKRSILMN